MLTAIKSPYSTDANTTPKKAPMQARKSSLSVFQMRIAALISIKLRTVAIIIEAKIALGVYLKSGVISNSVIRTTQTSSPFKVD